MDTMPDTMELETIALRAVEVTMQGREDPRLLVATKRRLPKPKKAARWLAGMANAADGRRPVLLIGLKGAKVHGIPSAPSSAWWTALHGWFAGTRPTLHSAVVDVHGAQVFAITSDPLAELLAAHHRNRVIVPWVEHDQLTTASPQRTSPGRRASDVLPSADILDGWVDRTAVISDGMSVDVYRGQLELGLIATPGTMADKACSATLLLPEHDSPIELDVQVHPASEKVGVFRHETGIDVQPSFRVRLYLAAAVPHDGERPRTASAQLVVSLLLPGRAVPELRSLLLSVDPATDGNRWLL